MSKIELLSPAGSYENMIAAANAGCDAVYIGGKLFGARALADNLNNEKMIEAIEYMHSRAKKIYLTVNTLLKDNELNKELYNYLLPFYEKGIDAVIVQDMGVLRFINRNFKGLPIHASTQMTLIMAEGAETLKEYGVTRFVAARELQLDEIKHIKESTKLEIEAFVHGALCYSYSGQCLLSSMIGQRSGNRGRCAQPCRMQYNINTTLDNNILPKNQQLYLLSPKDINTLAILPKLMESGIDSFKIEGRMKRYEYTAGVTRIYRKYMDLYNVLGYIDYVKYLEKHKEDFNLDIIELNDLYNRGSFCEGYYKQYNGRDMMSMTRPNHNGVLVGRTVNDKKIKFTENVNPQDILEIRKVSDSIYEFTLKEGAKRGEVITADFLSGQNIKSGYDVYRTKNNHLLDKLKDEYLISEKKLGIKGYFFAAPNQYTHMRVWLKLDDETTISAEAEGVVAQQAVAHPVTKEKVAAQIMKTSDTAYYFDELNIDIRGEIFLPISTINELRRKVLIKFKEQMIKRYEREICIINKEIANIDEESTNIDKEPTNIDKESTNIDKEPTSIDKDTSIKTQYDKIEIEKMARTVKIPDISVSVVNMEQLIKASEYDYVNEIYFDITDTGYEDIARAADIVKKRGKAFLLMLPHVFRKHSYDEYKENINYLDYSSIDGYIIRNMEQCYFFTKEFKSLLNNRVLHSDYMLYVMNKEAALFIKEHNISRITAPLELNHKELFNLDITEMELVCYGKLPLMVSSQCIKKNTKNCNKYSKNGMQEVFLDRMNKELTYISHCRHCYNSIFYTEPYCLLDCVNEIKRLNPKSIRLSFTTESKDETAEIIKMAQKALYLNQSIKMESHYKGHFFKGLK